MTPGATSEAACPLCLAPRASAARISTVRAGVARAVQVVECHDCGIFVFHDDTLADGPLSLEALHTLRRSIHRGSLYNTPCDVTRGLVTQARDAAGQGGTAPAS